MMDWYLVFNLAIIGGNKERQEKNKNERELKKRILKERPRIQKESKDEKTD